MACGPRLAAMTGAGARATPASNRSAVLRKTDRAAPASRGPAGAAALFADRADWRAMADPVARGWQPTLALKIVR
jgi:hypothetical protein